ncbi:MAG: hypothetical protein KatS3mg119_2071 [Rhodothalassiaceae bacterium]|nr:MAG: hypothetical protein KatS3mg119_2071 [Rhodothalassiaceae bacterium]
MAGPDGQKRTGGEVVAFTDHLARRLYDDALALAVRAKWIFWRERAMNRHAGRRVYVVGEMPAFDRQAAYATETLRLSSRIMHVVAFAMNRRALADGEIDEKEALSPERRLGGASVCLAEPAGDLADLPPAVRTLWEESAALYRRALQLERIAAAAAARAPARANLS